MDYNTYSKMLNDSARMSLGAKLATPDSFDITKDTPFLLRGDQLWFTVQPKDLTTTQPYANYYFYDIYTAPKLIDFEQMGRSTSK